VILNIKVTVVLGCDAM